MEHLFKKILYGDSFMEVSKIFLVSYLDSEVITFSVIVNATWRYTLCRVVILFGYSSVVGFYFLLKGYK